MKYDTLDQVFEAFSRLKVLIIGDVMVDAYIYGHVSRISPEAPVPVVNSVKRDYRLGGAGNVARNIRSIGAEPILCSVIGNDNSANTLSKILSSRHISTDGIVKSDHRPTTVKTRIIAGSQQMLRIDDETTIPLNNEEKNQFLTKVKKLVPTADVIIFEDYDKGTLNEDIIAEIIKTAKEHNIPTAVDPKKRNFLAYKNCDLFKPNLKELKEGIKIDFDSAQEHELLDAIKKLQDKINAKKTLITLSENGVLLKTENEIIRVPAHRRSIADVSGAGDTVISIAGLALALDLSDRLLTELANLGGGLVCEHLGVVPVKKEELLTEAKKNKLERWL